MKPLNLYQTFLWISGTFDWLHQTISLALPTPPGLLELGLHWISRVSMGFWKGLRTRKDLLTPGLFQWRRTICWRCLSLPVYTPLAVCLPHPYRQQIAQTQWLSGISLWATCQTLAWRWHTAETGSTNLISSHRGYNSSSLHFHKTLKKVTQRSLIHASSNS